jgi:hypothetical protein
VVGQTLEAHQPRGIADAERAHAAHVELDLHVGLERAHLVRVRARFGLGLGFGFGLGFGLGLGLGLVFGLGFGFGFGFGLGLGLGLGFRLGLERAHRLERSVVTVHKHDLWERDLHVELLAVTDGTPVLDHLLHPLDSELDLGVDRALGKG